MCRCPVDWTCRTTNHHGQCLQQLAPEAFDQAYVDLLAKKQKDNIEMLEDMSAQADNAIVRGLASDIIDIQQTQIEETESVQSEVSM